MSTSKKDHPLGPDSDKQQKADPGHLTEEKGRPPGFGWGGSEIRRVWESNPALQRDRLAY